MKKLTFSALSTPLVARSRIFSRPADTSRKKKGDMYYRRLGRTGLWISEISLGGSPLPEWALLLQIIEQGVNYIDTSHTYMNGNSERQIGRLLKEVGREKIHVATKFHLQGKWNEQSIIKSVEGSLKRLQTDYLDICMIHGAENPDHLSDERLLSAYEKLKKEGKYRFRGFTCHTNHHKVVLKAAECGFYDMIQIGYNVFDIEESKKPPEIYDDYLGRCGLRKLIDLAHSKDIGVIAMKTLKSGGRQQNLSRYKTGSTSIYQSMLKWVLENKKISSACTEILTYEQMEEDLAAVHGVLSSKERTSLLRCVAENSASFCHMCGSCQENCPKKVRTTDILRYLAYYETYGKKERALSAYAEIPLQNSVVSCTGCGLCEKNCPYGIAVPERIRYAHSLLA